MIVMLTGSSPRRLGRALLLAVALAVAAPLSAAAADTQPARTSTDRSATGQIEQVRFLDVNLYRPYAIVRQYTSYWCVPASSQTMINIINRTTDRTYATQSRYAWHAKRLNRYAYASRGNDPQGWARLLDKYVGGEWHYADRTYSSQTAGINAIVESIRRTGHPVGVVVDRGTHAWTVLGFRGTQRGDDLEIHGVYVTGPLYGRDPWPYRYYTTDQFRTRFTRYHEWQRSVVWEGLYVVISE
jgi:hypothetical protein